MDYSQLSDFEINVAVFEAIHNGSPDYKEGENGDMVFVSFEGDIGVEFYSNCGRFWINTPPVFFKPLSAIPSLNKTSIRPLLLS